MSATLDAMTNPKRRTAPIVTTKPKGANPTKPARTKTPPPPPPEETPTIVSSRRSKKLIADAAAALAAAEEKLHQRVHEARANGVTWEEVGEALGTTRQSAHARFTAPPKGGAK